MTADNDKPVPTITLKLTDPVSFNVEVDFETPSLQVARAMLAEAVHTIQSLINDQESLQFAAKMNNAAQAQRAMLKKGFRQ